MALEVVHGERTLKNLEQLAKTQVRVDSRIELKSGMRRVLDTSARAFLHEVERAEAEVTVRGEVVTRVIFIDETDSYNSEERTESFAEKITLAAAETVITVSPSAHVLETRLNENAPAGSVDVINTVDITLLGLTARSVRYVEGIKGEIESRRETVAMTTFQAALTGRFEVEESITLDRECEGVLGTDVTAALRDVVVNEGKISLKGILGVNVMAVKRVEGNQMLYNDMHEVDFAKTLVVKELGLDDRVVGAIAVAGVSVRAENSDDGSKLVLLIQLSFNAHIATTEQVPQICDAFSYTNQLNFIRQSTQTFTALPMQSAFVDVEGNITMPANAPYISRITGIMASKVANVNVVPAKDKITVEGVANTAIVYECEERGVHTHNVAVPFSAAVKVPGLTADQNIGLSLAIVASRIKARRGKEILVDCKMGISIMTTQVKSVELLVDISDGAELARDDSSILIYTVSSGETLWDVAKRISCPTREIIGQNPGAEADLKAGDKVFIYRQEVINF